MPHDAALRALDLLAAGDWDGSHQVCQSDEGEPMLDRIHAHLHRVEGDLGNAAYWYRRAGVPVRSDSLEAEFSDLQTDAQA